jgi:hypothetical protein
VTPSEKGRGAHYRDGALAMVMVAPVLSRFRYDSADRLAHRGTDAAPLLVSEVRQA